MRSRLALLLLLACLPVLLAACGDDDDGGSDAPQAFAVEANDEGVTAPESVGPGAIEIRFSNTGKKDHGAQVIKVGEGHTAAEVLEAGEAWGEKGKALPEWITFHGGVNTMEAGDSGTAVVDLDAGDYAVFDIESDADDAYAEFTVEGDEGEDLPDTDGAIEAREYSFTANELTAGRGQVKFENVGDEPHHLVAAPIKPGKTIGDVRNFIKTEKGAPPFSEEETFDTAILSGGTNAVIDVDLQSGDYALLCFIPDRAGGPPHAVKGMISAASVE